MPVSDTTRSKRPIFKIINSGYTRLVFLCGPWAFKIPTLGKLHTRMGLGAFKRGLLNNIQEAKFGSLGWVELCPVKLSLPGGFLVVMQRADDLPDHVWENFDYRQFVLRGEKRNHSTLDQVEAFVRVVSEPSQNVIPVENKQDSFGIIRGAVVALDYGGYR